MAPCAFFHAGPVGNSSVDDVILDCYRLAKYYGNDPDVWLAKPLSEVRLHLKWTGQLSKLLAEEAERARGDDG